MPQYPQITQGLGKLTPQMWDRLMHSLRDNEYFRDSSAMRVRDRFGAPPRGTNTNLVRVKNTGETATIHKLEACVIDDTPLEPLIFADNLEDCELCSGSTTCAYGECGSWPGSVNLYKDIYDVARTVPIVFQVKSGAEETHCIPTPGYLRNVFVAAQDILPGTTGWAYQSGMHYAWVFDPRGISNNGGVGRFDHEFMYADLPDYDFWYGRDAYPRCAYPDFDQVGFPAYSSVANNGNGCPGITVALPLMIRPQGRYRVHWVDQTTELFAPAADGGGELEWPIAYHASSGAINDYPKIRMGLVERMPQWQVPQIKARITSYAKYIDSDSVEQDLRYRYEWDYLLSGSYASGDIFNGWRVGDATNLAEHHNCVCTTAGCAECTDLSARDTAKWAAGVEIWKLDQCFGQGGWELNAISGEGCVKTAGYASEVMLTMGIDADGKQEPTFQIQNGIQSIC
jgi:hypothetical protein